MIATYNRARLLPRAMGSVLAQTFTDWELIIVDDGSDDDTADVIARFKDVRIHTFKHANTQGAGPARNTALAAARGEYIAPLDDDDELLPDALMEMMSALDDSPPEVGIVYGFRAYVNQMTGSARMEEVNKVVNGDILADALSLQHPIGSTAMLIRTDDVRAVGGYDGSVEFGEDTDLIVRLCVQGSQVRCVPKVLANIYEAHGERIRKSDECGRAESVEAYMRAHVARYRDSFDKRPQLYFPLAYNYISWTGRKGFAVSCLLRAASLHPTPANVYRSAKMLIWWTTPLSRFRDDARRLRNRLFGNSPHL